jgi:ABC-type uncharacterized transport system fused permease/ATPase subunit
MERMDTVRKPPLSQPPGARRLVLRSDSAIAQLLTLLRALIGSRRRRQLGLLALGVVVVICANAAGQIRLNIWQRATPTRRSSKGTWRNSLLSSWFLL